MEALVYQPHQTLLPKDLKQKGIWDKASTCVQLLFVFFRWEANVHKLLVTLRWKPFVIIYSREMPLSFTALVLLRITNAVPTNR